MRPDGRDDNNEKFLNPKQALRAIMEAIPADMEPELQITLLSLYAHSDSFVTPEDIDKGVHRFTVRAAHSQLAANLRISVPGLKKRLNRLRDKGNVSWVTASDRNKGCVYDVILGGPLEGGTLLELPTPGQLPHQSRSATQGSEVGYSRPEGGLPSGSYSVLDLDLATTTGESLSVCKQSADTLRVSGRSKTTPKPTAKHSRDSVPRSPSRTLSEPARGLLASRDPSVGIDHNTNGSGRRNVFAELDEELKRESMNGSNGHATRRTQAELDKILADRVKAAQRPRTTAPYDFFPDEDQAPMYDARFDS